MDEREALLMLKAGLERQRSGVEKSLVLVDSRLRMIGRKSTEADEAGFVCPPKPNVRWRSIEMAVWEIFKDLPEEFGARHVYEKLRRIKGKYVWSLSTVSALLSRWANTSDFLEIEQLGSGPQPTTYKKVRAA